MKRNLMYSLAVFSLALVGLSSWDSAGYETGKADPAKVSTPAETAEAIASGNEAPKAAAPEKLSGEALYMKHVSGLYQGLGLSGSGLDSALFARALAGYYNLKAAGKLPEQSKVISIVDFNKPSREKRLWVIDIEGDGVLHHTWVAHGQGSGMHMAERFSNREASHQSSLGFYITGEVYYGKHGRSLRLDGMDKGFNSKARERAIVLHGASYVSPGFIERTGRLGRSFGCPAVPVSECDDIIDDIRNKTVLFIDGPDSSYTSQYIDPVSAARMLASNG